MTVKHIQITGVSEIKGTTVRSFDKIVGVVEYVLSDGSKIKIALESDEAIHANAKVANQLAANAIEGGEDFRDLSL